MSHKFLFLCLLMLPAIAVAQQPTAPAPAPAAPVSQESKPATQGQSPANPPPQAPQAATSAPARKAISNAGLSAAAWTALQQGTASEKPRDRSDALVALSALDRNAKAISAIQAAVDDKDLAIRILAVTSLGEMKARPAIPRLRAALDDDSAQISFAAAQALWKMDDRTGREILYEVLNGERKGPGLVKGKLDKAKLEMHDPKALLLIGVNEASGAFLGPFSMGVSFLEEYAKHNPAPLQSLCAQLLASDNDPQTINELRDALTDNNWSVRAAAARALTKANRPEAIPQLKDMMENDKEQPARFAAAAAIVRLTERPVRNASAVSAKDKAASPPQK